MARKLFFYALLVLLIGCSPKDDDSGQRQAEGGVMQDHAEAIEQARAIERKIQDAAEKERHTIEQQGG